MSGTLSRRDILKTGGYLAVGLAAPRLLSTVARADVVDFARGAVAKDTILVVLQLSGGNDGLNTVVPYADALYKKHRPVVAHEDGKVLKLNETLGLHPSLGGMKTLYDEKKVAIVQNAGYPEANRSHFRSMEIWQTGVSKGSSRDGWLGRFLDGEIAAHGPLNPVVALALSTEKPKALDGQVVSVPCFASLADVQNMVGDADAEKMLRDIQGMDAMQGSATRAVQQASKTALDAMSQLKKQTAGYENKSKYADDSFGKGFRQIAQLIATCPSTRVVYFSTGGFDTHANQKDSHGKLMQGMGDALLAFQREMEAIGKADKVVVLVFSEFGRRVGENSTAGTDHGSAGPMFLVGSRVKGGIHGPNPDLANLDNGDVRMTQDFRGVYSATLDGWMGGDAGWILSGKFDSPSLYA